MKLLFAGDILLTNLSERNEMPLVDKEIENIIKSMDLACCNLEGPVTVNTKKAMKAGPSVKQGRFALERISQCGFNLFDLANNHIMDYGEIGLSETIEAITKVNPESSYIGAGCTEKDIWKWKRVERDGYKVGIIAVGENNFGVESSNHIGYAYMLNEQVIRVIREAREKCDHIILVCHCGAEELEVPLPEVRSLYKRYIDYGVDTVIGHHPHVIQGCEEYKGGQIFYSLGNFAFDSIRNPQIAYNPYGLLLEIELHASMVDYHVHTTYYDQGIVHLQKENTQFEKCNDFLVSEKYLSIVDKYCVELFEKSYKTYCCQAIGFHDASIYQRFLMALRLIMGRKIKYNNAFIWHNCVVDTNQWIYKHAIEEKGLE